MIGMYSMYFITQMLQSNLKFQLSKNNGRLHVKIAQKFFNKPV